MGVFSLHACVLFGWYPYSPQINTSVELRRIRTCIHPFTSTIYRFNVLEIWILLSMVFSVGMSIRSWIHVINSWCLHRTFHACILILRSLTRLWNCGEYLICNYWCMYTAYSGDQFLDQEYGRSFNAAFSKYELILRSWAWLWNCGESQYIHV